MAKRTGIQLCYPFEEKRLLSWEPPFLIQPKLDGERARLLVEPGPTGLNRCLLLSSSEDLITSVPHIMEEALRLPQGEYDGELYNHTLNQNQIHSIVSRRTGLHSNFHLIEFHIFDMVFEGQQWERTAKLKKLRTWPDYIFQVPTKICWKLEELYTFYDKAISEGYEGFVVRNFYSPYVRKRATHMLKFKPKKTDTYPIWDVEEAISESGSPLSMIGAFWCIDSEGTRFKVGAGHLTHHERRTLWEEFKDTGLRGASLEVEYQTLSTHNKVPLFSRALTILKGGLAPNA